MINANPDILLSIVNTKLRDFYPSLDFLCEDMDYDKEELLDFFFKNNIIYDSNLNQFRRM